MNAGRNHSPSYPPGTSGLTLVELVVAMAVMSVLTVTVSSAILMATRALPDNNGPAGAAITANTAAGQMATELQYAASIRRRSATAIEFTVADRNNDSARETICYGWSGVAGEPLTRQYNGGAAVNVLDAVRQLQFLYDTTTIREETPQGNESPNTLLMSYDPTVDLYDCPIKKGEWYSQYFLPSLPADAIGWSVTRVEFYAKAGGPAIGEARIQLQVPTVGGAPSGIVLEEKTLLESTLLSTYLRQSFTFASVSGLVPGRGLCLVIRWVSDAEACKLQGHSKSVDQPDRKLFKSTDGGIVWSLQSGRSLCFRVYGTATTPGTTQVSETHFVESIELQLQSGTDMQSDIRTRVKVLNRPEVVL